MNEVFSPAPSERGLGDRVASSPPPKAVTLGNSTPCHLPSAPALACARGLHAPLLMSSFMTSTRTACAGDRTVDPGHCRNEPLPKPTGTGPTLRFGAMGDILNPPHSLGCLAARSKRTKKRRVVLVLTKTQCLLFDKQTEQRFFSVTRCIAPSVLSDVSDIIEV